MGDKSFKLSGRTTGRGGFTIPLGGATFGHLVFASRAEAVTIHADAGMKALALGRFGKDGAFVRATPGNVIIQFPMLNQRIHLRGSAARINLNASLPWEIEFRSDARRVSADLQALQLNSLDILGNASQIALALSKPVSTAYIYLAGGADHVRITRPQGAGVRIQFYDGATQVSFDEQHFKAIAGEALLESKDYPHSASRYNISLCGKINVVEVSPR